MNYLKLFGKSILRGLIIILSSVLIITIFNYFNIFNDKISFILIFTSSIIAYIVSGHYLGKRSNNKGLIEGLKIGITITIIFIIISLISRYHYQLFNIIYYLILIISSVFGSILGKNKKEN